MSLRAYEWAARVECPDAICKAVLLQFASFHNQKTGQCNPSNATMVERTQLCKVALKRAVKRLENAGLVSSVGSRKGGRAKSIMRVLNAPESAGVKAFEFPTKGVTRGTPLKVIKGVINETPFSTHPKGVHQMTPDKGTPLCIEGENPGQDLKIFRGCS